MDVYIRKNVSRCILQIHAFCWMWLILILQLLKSRIINFLLWLTWTNIHSALVGIIFFNPHNHLMIETWYQSHFLKRLFGLSQWLSGKEFAWQFRRCGFNFCIRKTAYRRRWQHIQVLLPGTSHGHRSLVDYSPQGCKRVGRNLVTKQYLFIFFSCFRSQLWHMGSSLSLRLSCLVACRILLPRPGIKPVNPALGGRFSTTGPPGSLISSIFKYKKRHKKI